MALNAGQRIVSESRARFKVVISGRRWGKTYLAIRETAKIARFPARRIFLVYPTYRQAKQTVWDPLKYRLQDLNWVLKANESDLTLTLRNGSTISLRGADNFDSLRGVGLDAVIMDEFAHIEEKAWTEVLRPTLSDREGVALFIGTPQGTANWAHDLFQRGLDPNEPMWESFTYPTIEGGNVSATEIEQAMRDLDERTFRQEYLATFEAYQNRVYYAFDRVYNVMEWKKTMPQIIYVGLDFNVGMMSAAIFAQEGNNVYGIDEIALYSSNTSEICEEILTRYPKTKVFVYPDPSGNARKSSASSGVTDHTILKNAGFIVKAPHSHNPVRDGINAVNTKCCNAKGERSFFIDPKCKKMIESLEKHSYKVGTSIPDKDDGFDHFADAIRYYIDYVFPIQRELLPTQQQRFGHNVGGMNTIYADGVYK